MIADNVGSVVFSNIATYTDSIVPLSPHIDHSLDDPAVLPLDGKSGF